MSHGPTTLGLDAGRAGNGRREADSNGSRWSLEGRGIRLPALLTALGLTVGGGAYIKAKGPDDDVRARVLVIETQRAMEKEYMERRFNSIEGKVDLLVRALPPQGQEGAGRRR